MNILWLSTAFIAIVLLSWLITSWVYRYAVSHSILDHPNQRSLHLEPTPRGGGLSIVLLVLGGIVLLWLSNLLSRDFALGAFGGCVLVAVIGWVDDTINFSTVARGCFYLLASTWAVYWILGADHFSTMDNAFVVFGSILWVAWLTKR